MNLQDFLKADMLVPKKLLHEMRMSKKVTVNDDRPLWTKPLQSGDRITLPIFPERVEPQATAMPVDVLAEDEHLLIVNKKLVLIHILPLKLTICPCQTVLPIIFNKLIFRQKLDTHTD